MFYPYFIASKKSNIFKFHSLINDFWLTPLLANESQKKRPTKTFLFSSPIGKQQTDKFKNDIVNRDDNHVDNIPIQRIKITPLKCPSASSAYSTVESLEPPPPSIQKIHSKKVHKYTLRYALDLEKKVQVIVQARPFLEGRQLR